MQCSNNEKQIGLAVHNFHDSQNKLLNSAYEGVFRRDRGFSAPLQSAVSGSWWHRFSWAVAILPYMESTALYDNIATETNNYNTGPWGCVAARSSKPSCYSCPSDPNGKITTDTYYLGINYRASFGDKPTGDGVYLLRGAFGLGKDNLQMFGLEGITDGTSNTVCFSEAVVGTAENNTKVKGGMATVATNATEQDWQSVASGTNPVGPASYPGIKFSVINGKRQADGTIAAPYTGTDQRSGSRWYDSGPGYANFYTLMPPNGVSWGWSSGMFASHIAASSYHTGGVNVVMCDGSVHFVSDSVNVGDGTVDTFKGWTSSASPRGVWGAMGTRSGEEPVSMP
jgi:prepilin-type processing-associated H-X9-DG protein